MLLSKKPTVANYKKKEALPYEIMPLFCFTKVSFATTQFDIPVVAYSPSFDGRGSIDGKIKLLKNITVLLALEAH
jgi:hypothetical protein